MRTQNSFDDVRHLERVGTGVFVNANNTGAPQDIFFTAAPTMVGGGGALNTTTTSIIAYAIGDNGG